MNLGRFRSGAPTLHQRGFALIAMLALAALLTAFLITIGLSRTSIELSNEREDRNMTALRQAKAALIAYAASEQWQAYRVQVTTQPGGLPCPDTGPDTTVANTGVSSGICSGGDGTNRVGRLPFATIGSDDLRDASGERLWYAVSSTFFKSGNNVINSDTQGLLTVTGSAPATNVVAIVFAPGSPVQDPLLPGQTQDRGGAVNYNRIASYLENFTAGAIADYTFSSSALPNSTFNDRLLVITQAELMAAVEPVVAARIARDVTQTLNAYESQWNAFPFPSKLDNPDPGTNGSATTRSPMTYVGDPSLPNQVGGLLPLASVAVTAATNASPIVVTTYAPHTLSPGDVVWISGAQGNTAANGKWTVTVLDATRFQLNGSTGNGSYSTATSFAIVTPSYPWSGWSVSRFGGSGIIDNDSCVTIGGTPPPPAPALQCTFRARADICGATNCINNLVFQIQASVGSNAGNTFATLPATAGVSTTMDAVPSTFSSVSLTGSLAAITGVGAVTYTATLPASINCVDPGCLNHNIVVTIPDVVSSGVFSPSDNNVGWFVANEWYRQTYYAVSPGFRPGAGASCVPRPAPPVPAGSPSCLRVDNLSPAFAASNDKQAILIFAGRALNGSVRPSPTPNNYLEGANQTALTTVPFMYETRPGTPTSINDRVVVVAP